MTNYPSQYTILMTLFPYRTRRALLALLLLPALALTACDSGGTVVTDGFPGDSRLLGMWVDQDYEHEYLHFEHDAGEGVLRMRFIEHYPDEGCWESEEVPVPLDGVTMTTFNSEGINHYSISGSTLTLESTVDGRLELTRSNRTFDSVTPGCEEAGANARVASVLQQTGRDGGASWEDRALSAYTYDERGLLAETNTTSLQGNPGDEYRYVYEYDAEGRRTMSRYTYVGGELTTLYRYDASGLLSETRSDATGVDEWNAMRSRSRYVYDVQGLRERVVSESKGEGGVWDATGESRYSYDAGGKVGEIVHVSFADGQDTPAYRDRYSYAAGFTDRIELDMWREEAWALIRTTTYERDETGRVMTQTTVWAPGGECCAPNRYVYTWENGPDEGGRAAAGALSLSAADPFEAALNRDGPVPGYTPVLQRR